MSETTTPIQAASQEAERERKKRYKKTLNLPRTAFPMRANLPQNEPQSLARWQREGLYPALVEARAAAPRFTFHDGPPYANGSLHGGHMINKVLKDLVIRSRHLVGMSCPFIPGWDCHGLPIEHKVVAELHGSGKLAKLDQLEVEARHLAIRRACARYAAKFQKLQLGQMQRLLALADYEHPYLTMDRAYEEAVLEVFAELVEQGLVYRALKPVHWSIANQTALADAELEYRERTDPSIYVGFATQDPARLAAVFGAGTSAAPSGELLIWTTTPWTLPANLLTAVHAEHRYALVRAGDRSLVIARELVARVLEAAGLEASSATVLGEAAGRDLVGLEYHHPFCERGGRVVSADYVTLEDGTGLVHTAPGHGVEDFETGQREGLEVYCPVRGDGTYDDSVPEWLRGLSVWEANGEIVERLRASGHLFHHVDYDHSYPHDWRSKTPVIFRCTEQWFVAVDRPTRHDGQTLRQLALAACEGEIAFTPAWGQRRFASMIEQRPDWCLSRQRSWGLPIPAFRRPDGSVFLTAASARAVARVYGREGSDAWFQLPPEQLLADWDAAADPEAPPGIVPSELEPMFDILDVWFESGSSWYAVMDRPGRGYPIDLYLEGSDQHRGWFQLSILLGLAKTGRSPFRQLLTHGFTVDKDGHKMSKSLGNTLELDDLLADYGADVCRWWVSSVAYEGDVKIDRELLALAGESYRKVRNTLRFLLSNLADFEPASAIEPASLAPSSLDAWALAAAAELRRKVLAAYERYEIRRAHLLLFDFCNDTLSSFYLDAVKDRLYCDRPDSPRRRACQSVLLRIADLLHHLLAPILPHTADEAHRALHGEASASVHLGVVPGWEPPPVDGGWEAVLVARDAALKALEASPIENRLDAGLVLPDRDGVLARFDADLADLMGVSRVRLERAASAALEVVDLRDAPRCERSWRRDETVARRADGGWLSDRDAEAVGL